MLPDSTGTDLDQHLSNLVGTTPPSTGGGGGGGGGGTNGTQMTHQSLLTNGSQTSISSSNGGSGNGGLLTPRHQNYSNSSSHEYIQSSQNGGPRSLSDSSQAESPVQDDLLSSNTPTLGGTINQFQNQNSYGSPSSGCNGSIYPVLPASILYSQLYTAANQGHSFHSHGLGGGGQNSVHGELQTVMDHLATTGSRQNHQLMTGHTDLTIIGNCGTAARGSDEARQFKGQPGSAENGNSVWRPY